MHQFCPTRMSLSTKSYVVGFCTHLAVFSRYDCFATRYIDYIYRSQEWRRLIKQTSRSFKAGGWLPLTTTVLVTVCYIVKYLLYIPRNREHGKLRYVIKCFVQCAHRLPQKGATFPISILIWPHVQSNVVDYFLKVCSAAISLAPLLLEKGNTNDSKPVTKEELQEAAALLVTLLCSFVMFSGLTFNTLCESLYLYSCYSMRAPRNTAKTPIPICQMLLETASLHTLSDFLWHFGTVRFYYYMWQVLSLHRWTTFPSKVQSQRKLVPDSHNKCFKYGVFCLEFKWLMNVKQVEEAWNTMQPGYRVVELARQVFRALSEEEIIVMSKHAWPAGQAHFDLF